MSRSDFISNLPSGSAVLSEDGSYNWQDVLLRDATSTNHVLLLLQEDRILQLASQLELIYKTV